MSDKSVFTQDSPRKPDRRRSQRSLLVMPLAVSWTTSTGMRVREHAETEVVSASGCLMRMKTRIPNAGTVDIKRPATNQSANVKVVTVSNPGPDGWIRVGVEFVVPNNCFWGIVFPPLEAEPAEEKPVIKPTLATLMGTRTAITAKPATMATIGTMAPLPAPPPRLPAALQPQLGVK